jgi:hypothetical protein
MNTPEIHLSALELGLSNARLRLNDAKSEQERTVRALHVRQYEKEIADEKAFLGLNPEPEMSDAELLAALTR